jgi:hypothetical protein
MHYSIAAIALISILTSIGQPTLVGVEPYFSWATLTPNLYKNVIRFIMNQAIPNIEFLLIGGEKTPIVKLKFRA